MRKIVQKMHNSSPLALPEATDDILQQKMMNIRLKKPLCSISITVSDINTIINLKIELTFLSRINNQEKGQIQELEGYK